MNIASLLTQQATSTPNATALIQGAGIFCRKINFLELEQQSNGIASRLRVRGIGVGHPVLVLHPITAKLYAILIAPFKLGAIPVFIDPTFTRKQIRACIDRSKPVACITSRRTAMLPRLCPELLHLPNIVAPRRESRAAAVLTDVPETAPALITFTSGSTGVPKGIVRTHGFLRNQLAVLSETLNLKAGEVELTTLPIFVLANIAAGMTSVLPPTHVRSKSPSYIIDSLGLISHHHVNRIAAAPAFIERLCDTAARNSQTLASLTRIDTGGGPIFPVLLEKLKHRAPGTHVNMIYGSTECEPIACISASELQASDLKHIQEGAGVVAGRIHQSAHVRIVKSFNSDLVDIAATRFNSDLIHSEAIPPDENVPHKSANSIAYATNNEIGEIIVSGEHVIKGYLQSIGDSETKIKIEGEIWHRTGDAGYIDDSGRLWLVGRTASVVSDDHGVFYPFQIEAPARSHPSIKRAALAQHHGKRILLIEPARKFGTRQKVDADQIQQQFQWANLDRIVPINRIPLDARHGSKIDYGALAAVLNS